MASSSHKAPYTSPTGELKTKLDIMFDFFDSGLGKEGMETIQGDAVLASWVATHLSDPVPTGDHYQQKMFNFMTGGNTKSAQDIVSKLPLTASSQVLELGFGGGVGYKACLERLQKLTTDAGGGEGKGERGAKLVGLDYSEDCCREMKSWLDSEGKEKSGVHTDIICSSMNDPIPLPDDSVDVIHSLHCFYFWSSLPYSFGECLRVLKPGGQMVAGHNLRVFDTLFGPQLPLVRNKFKNLDQDSLEGTLATVGYQDVHTSWTQLEPDKPLAVYGATVCVKPKKSSNI